MTEAVANRHWVGRHPKKLCCEAALKPFCGEATRLA
jgi:hypothetical protein